jgi:uncharacterized phage-like protein YoqJ
MIVAGTGHRPNKLGGYDNFSKERVYNHARRSIPKETTKLVSGMALGWDMALAHAALDKAIPLIAAIPFKGQEKMWPKESKEEYHWLLSHATSIAIVSEGSYAIWKMQALNQWMVDYADTILALWDGSDGGTANCVRYANKVGRPVINTWKGFNE